MVASGSQPGGRDSHCCPMPPRNRKSFHCNPLSRLPIRRPSSLVRVHARRRLLDALQLYAGVAIRIAPAVRWCARVRWRTCARCNLDSASERADRSLAGSTRRNATQLDSLNSPGTPLFVSAPLCCAAGQRQPVAHSGSNGGPRRHIRWLVSPLRSLTLSVSLSLSLSAVPMARYASCVCMCERESECVFYTGKFAR